MAQCIKPTQFSVGINNEDNAKEALQMESIEVSKTDDSMATVIRIKRKRSADPVEALLMTCKKSRHDEDSKGNGAEKSQVEEKVFHFATTLNSDAPMDGTTKAKVLEAISLREKINTMYKKKKSTKRPFAASSLSDLNGFEKLKHKLKSVKLSTKAPTEKQCSVSQTQSKLAASLPGKSAPAQSQNQPALEKNVKTVPKNISKIDDTIVASSQSPKEEDIYCNSVKMMREKLFISKPHREDYVYDLYYCRKAPPNWNVQDILYVRPYEEVEFVHEVPDEDGDALYEDDYDSNDEDDYRNDYPDEESEDSVSDDVRRYIFDEEEMYGSDDCDAGPRHDHAYENFVAGCYGYEQPENDYDRNDCVAERGEDYTERIIDDEECLSDDY